MTPGAPVAAECGLPVGGTARRTGRGHGASLALCGGVE